MSSDTERAGAAVENEDATDELDAEVAGAELYGAETEDDIAGASDINFRDVVLAPSDWTVETILSQLTNKSFELDPDFQRRNAWTDLRKSKFIESLMVGLPIPQLVFAEFEDEDDGDARYLVIDGKQRLLALESFYSGVKPLRLSGLTVLPQLNGKVREEIAEDPAMGRYVRRLNNRTIRTVVIRRWPHSSFLHLVFHRINHQTLALSAQELRQALHPGPFTRFVDKFAGSSEPLHRVLGASQRPDFRMRDVELLVRHLAYRFRIDEYKGNLKRFLDDVCRQYNSSWELDRERIENGASACDRAIEVTEEIFGNRAFRRYASRDWENRFNRAVFDIMTYYFADEAVASAALGRAVEVQKAYVALSQSDSRFRESLTTTTKTLPTTVYRLQRWGVALGSVLETGVRGPVTRDGKTITVEALCSVE